MQTIYLISGLGADERVFQLLDFSGYHVIHIQWTNPLKNMNIEAYATSLLSQIKDKRPVIIGLSFGGMIAVEITKQIETSKTILIASVKTKYEIPFYYRFAGSLRLHKLIPTRLIKQSNFINNWLFGVQSTNEQRLLKAILNDTDSQFLAWAIDKITRWKNTQVPKNIIHIHGTSDRILPYIFVKEDIKIKGGGHFMTLNKHLEISTILKRKIKS